MAQLLVRNLDEDVKRRLGIRAARNGHSMEQEVRDILRNTVDCETVVQEPLGTRIAKLFAGIGLRDDEELPEIRGVSNPADFDE